MSQDIYARIQNNPKFHELVNSRSRFAWLLSAIMLTIYFAFILVIAYAPGLFGTPLAEGRVTTIGLPIGVGVILSAIALTGIYVYRANSRFDELTREILKDSK